MVRNIKYPLFVAGPTWSSEMKSAVFRDEKCSAQRSAAGEACGRRLCSHVVTYPLLWNTPPGQFLRLWGHATWFPSIGLSYFPLSFSLPFTFKWKCKAYPLSYICLGKVSTDPTEDSYSGDDNSGPQVDLSFKLLLKYNIYTTWSHMYTEWIFRSWIPLQPALRTRNNMTSFLGAPITPVSPCRCGDIHHSVLIQSTVNDRS